MNRIVFAALAIGMGLLAARAAGPVPPVDATTAFAMRPPDENSPFFFDALLARQSIEPEFRGRLAEETVAQYPRTKDSSKGALAIATGFFTGMFSSVNLGPLRTPPTTTTLKVDPSSFALQDRREVNVTYSIRNNTKRLTRIEYPTSQRIEILTIDAQGKPIDRWSDDRAFEKQEGIVVINPHERIEYQEKIPTREMKAGEAYKVEASVASEPNFASGETITPK